MFKIVKKKILNPQVKLMEISAPHVAKKAEPGQFIILRVNENGERIPLTIADFDREKGTVTIIFRKWEKPQNYWELWKKETNAGLCRTSG